MDIEQFPCGEYIIHPTAQIGQYVQLRGCGTIGANVRIHDFVILDGYIEIGENTDIGEYTIISGCTFIGKGNRFSAFCSLGASPQHARNRPNGEQAAVCIGDDNVFREYTAVYMPFSTTSTSIGNRCYIMARSQIDHDAVLGDQVKVASGCAISGHVQIDHDAYIGVHAAIHQRLHIGAYAMVGMGSSILKHVMPGSTVFNQTFTKLNIRGLRQNGFSNRAIAQIDEIYQRWALDGVPPDRSSVDPTNTFVKEMVDFFKMHEARCYMPSVNYQSVRDLDQ